MFRVFSHLPIRLLTVVFFFSLNCPTLGIEAAPPSEDGSTSSTTLSESSDTKTSKPSLVQIFCGALVMEPLDFANEAAMSTNWELLGEAMEEGKFYSSLATSEQAQLEFDRLKESESYLKCVSEHGPEVELGTFIIVGKQVLKQTAASIKVENEPMLMSASFLIEEREVNAGNLELNIQNVIEQSVIQYPGGASETELKALSERQQRYHQLWLDFLIQLKAHTQPTGNTL